MSDDRVRELSAGDLLVCMRWRDLSDQAHRDPGMHKVLCHRCKLTLGSRDVSAIDAGALPTCAGCLRKLTRADEVLVVQTQESADRAEEAGVAEEWADSLGELQQVLNGPKRAGRARRRRRR